MVSISMSENMQRDLLNQSQFNLSPMNIVATLCLFSVVFLGLKLWWFRAKIQFDDMRPKKKDKDTVQGIGIKLNTNVEMRQVYKSISEFATIDVSPIRNEGHFQTENIQAVRQNVNRILENSRVDKNPVNFTKNESKPVQLGSPASLNKHKRSEPITNDFIYDVPVNHCQIKNNLPSVPKIIDEKAETQMIRSPKCEDNFLYENLRFQNIKNNQNHSGIYSNQAASIFYGHTGDNTPSPPTPKPSKFLEDCDDISLSGQTNA